MWLRQLTSSSHLLTAGLSWCNLRLLELRLAGIGDLATLAGAMLAISNKIWWNEAEGEGGDGGTGVVTVLLYDGNVLEFPHRIKCSELLASYPGHTLCPASALVLKQQGKMLQGESFLEPRETYFLLPKPGGPGDDARGSAPESSMRFKISKEYLSRILSERGRDASPPAARSPEAVTVKSLDPLEKRQRRRRGKSKQPWVSSLASIPEVAPV